VLDEKTLLCFCDFETTGVDHERDFPIEIACVWVNHQLEEVARLEGYIRPRGLVFDHMPGFFTQLPTARWLPEHKEGHRFHKIDAATIQCYGRPASAVVKGIMEHNVRALGAAPLAERIVLLSDCAVFEHAFMRKLFDEARVPWPFHYNVWETSLLLEMTGVGDPPTEEMEHRAMADVEGLLDHVRRAYSQIKKGL